MSSESSITIDTNEQYNIFQVITGHSQIEVIFLNLEENETFECTIAQNGSIDIKELNFGEYSAKLDSSVAVTSNDASYVYNVKVIGYQEGLSSAFYSIDKYS